MKVLHICFVDKFIPSFVEFINTNMDPKEHYFLITGNTEKYPILKKSNVKVLSGIAKLFYFVYEMNKSKKIILHGLFGMKLIFLLSIQPWLLKKCNWVIWGGDLYTNILNPPEKRRAKLLYKLECSVKRRLSGYITYLKGDFELAINEYGSKSQYCECIMYPSNFYKEFSLPASEKIMTTILVGNSSDPTNNHEETFSKLAKLEDQNFNIICPLSYGNGNHAIKIERLGSSMFGNRFAALMSFMEFDEYLKIIAKVDVAIFAHKRQSAMGNTITLLGLGKKVYMRSDISSFALFNDLNIKVFDVQDIVLDDLDEESKKQNRDNTKKYFSEENLIKQFNKIFED